MWKQYRAVLACLFLLTGCSGTSPDLGVKGGRLMDCPATPNCVNSQATDDSHGIAPISYPGPASEAESRLLKILEGEERVKIVAQSQGYIRAEFTSAVFRFVDDVEFYIPEMQGDKTVIQVRSASRLGYSDLGVNRKRVEMLRRKLVAPESR